MNELWVGGAISNKNSPRYNISCSNCVLVAKNNHQNDALVSVHAGALWQLVKFSTMYL